MIDNDCVVKVKVNFWNECLESFETRLELCYDSKIFGSVKLSPCSKGVELYVLLDDDSYTRWFEGFELFNVEFDRRLNGFYVFLVPISFWGCKK